MVDLKKRLQLKEIQVLLGVRRSGKSTLFKLMINHLLKENEATELLYLNFDDPFFSFVYNDVRKMQILFDNAEKLTGTKIRYLFLDEIQHVAGWEKLIKSLYDSELYTKIFITGSNSSLLQNEYATLLSGRYTVLQVFPFSFSEILKHGGIKDKLSLVDRKPEALRIVDDMMEFGSFPEIMKTCDRELKREMVLSYYETILLKDCVVNGGIRDVKTFQELAHYLLSNVAALFSYNSIAKAIGSNDQTVKDLIHILEKSFIFTELKLFSWSLKKQVRNKKKMYSIDNSFPANISFRFSSNKGKLFENLVFSELKKSGKKLFFFNGKNECDFITHGDVNVAYQVCYEITEENRKREVNGLREAMDKFDIPEGYIITYNQEEVLDDIEVAPFWKFFSYRD